MSNAMPLEAPERVLEQGSATFLYRPRVILDDVQRFILVLSPEEGPFQRAISIGRRRVSTRPRQDRFWGFVDLILTPPDMNAALGAKVYGARARAGAELFADGTYELTSHAGHAHLRWNIGQLDDSDPVARELALERDADYVLTVMNPEPGAWGLSEAPDLQAQLFDDLELHVTIPSPFPPALQQRFRNRKYAQVDSSEWLDHPGAELVFVGAGD